MTFLWYIPNQVDPGHRGDDTVQGHNSIERLTELAQLTEDHGWAGALIGTGWGRPVLSWYWRVVSIPRCRYTVASTSCGVLALARGKAP